MLDTVDDPLFLVAKDDVAVLSHDLNDQLLPAQVAELIQVFDV